MVKIDKGVPIPDYKTKPAKYPWKDMKVGDSFLSDKPTINITGAVQQAQRKWKMKFTIRKEGKGCRVWRVA